jgi:endonuclease YncB( thermonuclease family)
MFRWIRWPRTTQGFEWQEYVRTTVKLRRDERRQKIEEIREAAIERARQARRQGMAAGRQGVDAGRHGLIASRYRLARWAGRVSRALRAWAAAIGRSMAGLWRWIGAGLRGGVQRCRAIDWRVRGPALSTRAKISGLFGGLAVLAGASSLMQVQDFDETWPAVLAGLVALALAGIALAPWAGGVVARGRSAAESLVGLRCNHGVTIWRPLGYMAAILGVIGLGAGGWLWLGLGEGPRTSSITTASIGRIGPPLPRQAPTFEVPVPETVSGRARTLSGDTLEVDGRVVRLSHIEAVELGQVCQDARGRAWRCGERARRVLRDLVRRRAVHCNDLARSGPGSFEGTCTVGGLDLAKAVVAAGYAFAEGFFFRTYGEEEGAARDARRGVWQGEVERPADYRAARWARAKATAPDGCPIKGQVTRRAKTYVVPWAPDYARLTVRRSRGERWFCSEADAAAAGFMPAIKG